MGVINQLNLQLHLQRQRQIQWHQQQRQLHWQQQQQLDPPLEVPPARKRKQPDDEASSLSRNQGGLQNYLRLPGLAKLNTFVRGNDYPASVRMYISRFINSNKLVGRLIAKWEATTAQIQGELDSAVQAAFRSKRRRTAETPEKYWTSTRASSTFGPWMPKEGDETDPLTVMEARAVRLKKAWTSPCGWREVVHGTKEDIDLCTPTNVHWLRLKCRLISNALEIAMTKMPEQTWYECCDEAVRRVNEVLASFT